jgi:hypothetical protein
MNDLTTGTIIMKDDHGNRDDHKHASHAGRRQRLPRNVQ